MPSSLILANPAGLWLLLGLPLVLLIHYFQQPSRRLEISTFFLLEAVPPESLRGRTFEKLRHSLPLWLQLLSVLLLVWLVIDPRWLRAHREQRVLLLLDSSASMSAFPGETAEALKDIVETCSKQTVETNWTLMETYPGTAKLYEGTDSATLLNIASSWKPGRPRHDFAPMLELAASWQSNGNTAILITDGQEEGPFPVGRQLVGRNLDNVGIVGAEVHRAGGVTQWSVVIRNFSRMAQERNWHTEVEGVKSAGQTLRLEPDQSRVVGGTFAEGRQQLWVEMDGDAFALDDRVPLFKSQERLVRVSLQTSGKSEGFFKKLIERSTVAKLEADKGLADVVIASSLTGYPEAVLRQDQASIVLRQRRETADRLEPSPVVAEKHPLVEHLRWQGLLSSGPEDFLLDSKDQVLVWQKTKPLIFLRLASAPSLMLNFDFEYSNADRLPAILVMINRFLEEASRSLPGYRAVNLAPGQSLRVRAPESGQAMELQAGTGREQAKQVIPAGTSWVTAPMEPGFFQVNQSGAVVMDGAVQFLEPFESDFSKARTENDWKAGIKKLQETRSLPDPLRQLWLLLLAVLFLWQWWLQPGRTHAV